MGGGGGGGGLGVCEALPYFLKKYYIAPTVSLREGFFFYLP